MSTAEPAYHIVVWAELPELSKPSAGAVDCPESSYLCGLVGAGLPAEKFALGVRTPQERERFEAAHPAGGPLDTGDWGYGRDDASSMALYGVRLHPATPSQLHDLLTAPGTIIVIGGIGGGLPTGTTAAHSTTYEVLADGSVVLADPMRPNGSAPVPMPNPLTVIPERLARLVAAQGSADIRYAKVGEFAPAQEDDMDPLIIPDTICAVSAGPLYKDSALRVVAKADFKGSAGVGTYGEGTTCRALRVVWGTTPGSAIVVYVPLNRVSNVRSVATDAALKAARDTIASLTTRNATIIGENDALKVKISKAKNDLA